MMKKIIALALALSMALSMVAFAGFSDADKIEADLSADIELVTALGLMKGNTDGSFNPNGTLTRAEAAVILARLHSGDDEINDFWGDTALTVFSDVSAHWGLKYINYCAGYGLVQGDGAPANTFRPNDPVKCSEMAKMLLCLAGYDSDKEEFGAKWPTAAITRALSAGLLDGYEMGFDAAAPRQWVAKMVANMLSVQTVGYNQTTGKLEITTAADKQFGAKYGIGTLTGILTATKTEKLDSNDLASTAGYAKIDNTTTIKAAVSNDLIGRTVKVYFENKDKSVVSSTDSTPTYTADEKVYAVVAVDQKVIETTADQITYVVDDGEKTLTINGEKVLDAYEGTVTMNRYESLVKLADDEGFSFGEDAVNDTRPVTVIVNSDEEAETTTVTFFFNKVEYAFVTDHKASECKFKAGSINLAGATTPTTTDKTAYGKINFVDTVAKDEYVAIETVGNATKTYNVSKPAHSVVKMDTVNFEGADVVSFVVAGVTYVPNAEVVAENWAPAANADALELDYDVYTDGKYVVYVKAVAEQQAEVKPGLNMNLAYLIASQNKTTPNLFDDAASTDYVQVMLTDGSIVVYEYKVPTGDNADADAKTFGEVNTTTTTDGQLEHGMVYELVENNDGTVYFKAPTATPNASNKAVAGIANAGAYTYDETLIKSYMTAGSKKLFATADTFFFVKKTYTPEGGSLTVDYAIVKASEIKDNVSASAGGNWQVVNKAAYTINSTTGLNYLAYATLVGTVEDLPCAAPSAVGGNFFVVTETANKVVTADGATWTVKGINAAGEVETLVLTSNLVGAQGATEVEAGYVYVITTKGDETYLSAFASAPSENVVLGEGVTKLSAGWYKTLISGTMDGAVMLNKVTAPVDPNAASKWELTEELVDLADDAVVTYIYEDDGEIVVKAVSGVKVATAANYYKKTATIGGTKYVVYTVEGSGTEVIKKDGNWFKRSDATKAWGDSNALVDVSRYINDSTAKEDPINGNTFSFVCVNADGEISNIIIAVTSATSNTLKDASGIVEFVAP